MLYTARKIKDIKTCSYKGYLSQFSYNTEQNQFLHLLSLTKQCIKEGVYKKSYAIKDWFDENVDSSFYIFEQQKDVDRKSFVAHMKRFGVYMRDNQGEIIDSDVSRKVSVLGEEVLVKSDFVIRYPDKIELVKISNSKPKLSYNARSDENKPENNFELWLMQKLGEEKYPDRVISSAFYHMLGKFDEKETYDKFLSGDVDELANEVLNLESEYNSLIEQKKKREANKLKTVLKKIKGVLEYDGEQGSHIIRQSAFNENYILDELHDVFNKDLSEGSEKAVGKECDRCNNYVLCQSRQHVKVDLEVIEEEVKGDKKKVNPTEAQLELINFNNGYARANCVGGSGKSVTVALRIAKLLETNKPSEILAITFTNAGAEEMRNKVANLTNVNPNSLQIFTFNSFGMYIIEREWDRLGYKNKPFLIDRVAKVDHIKDILKMDKYSNLSFLEYKYPTANLKHFKGAIFSILEYFDNISSGDFDESDENSEIIKAMYEDYQNILTENCQIEYDDQILLATKLLKENKDLIKKYSVKHMLIDEMNDTNLRQIEFTKALELGGIDSLVVLGDDCQSIYGFNKTSPRFMIEFDKHFGEYTDIFMTQNFRSYSEICELCNRFIKLNTFRIDKEIVSAKGKGGKVELIEYDNISEEYDDVANIIKNNYSDDYTKVAILARTRDELLTIQKVLNKNGIPNKISMAEVYLNNHNVRMCINLAKYLKSDDVDTNDYYLFEYVSSISEETGKDELALLINQTKDVIINLQDENYEKLEIFSMMVETLLKKEDDKVARKFIENILNQREWYSFTELEDHLSKYVSYRDNSASDRDSTKYKAVTLTTFHGSKGLEWDTVFLLFDKFKYETSMSIDEVEEVRRLGYVGMSRPMRNLYMMYNINMDKSRNKGKYPEIIDEIRICLNKLEHDEHLKDKELKDGLKDAFDKLSPEDKLLAIDMSRSDFPH